jgi:hypothetical protein
VWFNGFMTETGATAHREPSLALQTELNKLTKAALVELARQTTIPGREADPVFGTVLGILGKRAGKGEYAYHIARVQECGY